MAAGALDLSFVLLSLSRQLTQPPTPSPPAIAQMLSTMLYSARFFPFYINCLLGACVAEL